MRIAGVAFSGRVAAVCYVLATMWVQRLASLPSLLTVGILFVGLILLAVVCRSAVASTYKTYVYPFFVPLLFGVMAFYIAVFSGGQRLSEQLAPEDENRVSKVVFQVAELPRLRPDSRQFVARVIESRPAGVPQRILVNWSAPGWAGPYAEAKKHAFPDVYPGQIWQANVIVKTPHGSLNPNGFDYESYLFAQGIRAVASVRGSPRLLGVEPLVSRSPSLMAESVRHAIRDRMLPFLEGMRYGGVITALSIGDQASILSADWEIFNRSGLTHLVSISGAHVTLIASLVAAGAGWGWRRLRFRGVCLAEWLPAQTLAAYIAVVVAGLYCVIAGWGVPAQRTFLMLSIIVFSYLWRLPLQATQVLAIAAVAVLMLDPWAILSSGFWLSFGAVGVLFACGAWQGQRHGNAFGLRRHLYQLKVASVWQLIITAALLPPLALMFNEISLISPLSNAYAIPLISLVVTPLSLLFAATSMVSSLDPLSAWIAWAAHGLIELMMWPTLWLCKLPIASITVAKAPTWCFVVALLGVAGALTPKAFFAKDWLWVLLLPCLFWGKERLAQGEWRLTALDVGQGSALVIQTAHSTLLFDTGVRRSRDSDVGQQSIHPFLRSVGVRAIDLLVVSHADLDHAGGATSVLQRYGVQQSYSNFDLPRYIRRDERLLNMPGKSVSLPMATSFCRQGQKWQVDGVQFEFLWPQQVGFSESNSAQRNAQSCVLSIRGPWHSAVLLGDIGVAEEAALIRQGISPHDVVIVGHHGSNNSSGSAFVTRMKAKVAVAQAGWWSRFGHPHPQVQRRWSEAGAAFLRTDFDGAITILSTETDLTVRRERLASQRYWHNHTAHPHLR